MINKRALISYVKRAAPEPVVIDVLWGKVATKVGTFLARSMNLVHTFPHGPQIVKL
jgi:uracil DNA glycosylase